MATINITGTGGIIEGNLGSHAVNVNLDSALSFDGTDDYINVGDNNSLDLGTGDFTFSAWIKLNALGDYNMIFDKGSGASRYSFLVWGDNRLAIHIEASFISSLTITDTEWHFVGVSCDRSGNATFNLDGKTDTVDISSKSSNDLTNTDDLRIGVRFDLGDHWFNGILADARIYNTALSEPNMRVLTSKINSDSSLGAGTTNLKGWWKLDGNESSGSGNVPDNSPQSNTGTLTGTSKDYDAFSVDVQDNSTTTDGTFTITQGKVEGKALSSLDSEEASDTLVKFTEFNIGTVYTLSCWVNHESVSGAQTYFGGNSANEYFDLQNSGDTLLLRPKSTIAAVQIDVSDAIGAPLATGRWYHLAVSRTDTAVDFYIDGEKAGTTQTLAGNEAHAMDALFAEHDGGTDYIFDGKGRDFRIYDFALSADQMASLYSNTFNVTPLHWWKFDEGYATAALNNAVGAFADSGTGTAANGQGVNFVDASCVNGTLDLDSTLTISANGTLSAPRGELEIHGATGVNRAGSFIHNNGTVDFTGATTVIQGTTMTGSNAFYIIKSAANTWYRIDADIDIERHALSGYVFWFYGGTVTMGTDTHSSGTDNSNKCIGWTYVYGSSTATYKLYAKDELYPWVYDYPNVGNSSWINGSQNSYMGNVHLKWGNFIGDFTIATAGGAKTITLDGDMEFDGLTLETNNTLDLNGNRVEFGGVFQNNGAMKSTGGGLIIGHDSVRMGGSAEKMHDGDVNMIIDGGVSNDWRNGAADGAGPWCRNVLINGSCTSGDAIGPGSGYSFYNPESVIVGNGSLTINDNVYLKNLTIATGGTLTAGNARIHDLYGDFTMSGGLIGLSGLDMNGTSTTCTVSDASDFDSLTNATWMGWFKIDDVSVDRAFMGQSSSFSLQVLENSTNKPRFSLYGGASWTDLEGNTTITVDNKWHHIAFVMDGSNNKMYIYLDGKLDSEGAWTDTLNGSGADIYLGGYRSGNEKHFAGLYDSASFWNVALTATQIRAKMFSDFASLDSNTGCKGWWQFDEGTGTSVASEVGSHTATVANGAWAGAGTYDKTEGPTLIMAGVSGGGSTAQNINVKNGADIYNLTIDDGVTASLHTIDNSAGLLDIYGNLEVNEKLTSSASSNTSGIRMKTAAKTLTVADGTGVPADVRTTALATLYQVVLDHSGITEIDEMNLKVVELQSGATLKATGDFTVTTELEVGGACTLNANGKTLTCKLLDMNGTGTLNLVGSTLILSSTDGLTSTSNTILNGGPGTTVSGSSAATTFESQNNFSIVGKVENLNVTNEELKVTGQVINCTGDIHHYFPTIDHDQQLDADTADDRDVNLGRDLDKNTELINS